MNETLAVVLLAAIGALGILVIHLWGRGDTVQTITALVTFLAPTIAALLALRKADTAANHASDTGHAVRQLRTDLSNGSFAAAWEARRAAVRSVRPAGEEDG